MFGTVSWFGVVLLQSWFFFFSSRRRHTRLQGDWSSDVCSSDLEQPAEAQLHSPKKEKMNQTCSRSSPPIADEDRLHWLQRDPHFCCRWRLHKTRDRKSVV